MGTPITEEVNPITLNIDVADSLGIVSLLQQCDAEIFEGWGGYDGLYHPSTIKTTEGITDVAASLLQNTESNLIVISGCGTSGRMAFVTARTFNNKLVEQGKPPCFDYLIAGKDKALFTSQEAPEDDPLCGTEMLKEVCQGRKRVLFIGVTCGLSAPYVAGQLDYCMQNLDWITPVLLGFNPTNLSRNIPIEQWDRTFLQVAKQLEDVSKQGRAFVLNPVVGPEPITGSSRMKCGTATKILLESIFVPAFTRSASSSKICSTKSYLDVYRCINTAVYKQMESIASLVKIAGQSLKSGGNIYYIGWDSLGIMGLIDASECPPTYGATLDEIRGFLSNGYSLLSNKEGDLSQLGKHFRISLKAFEAEIMPQLKTSDLVIMCQKANNIDISSSLWGSQCKKCLVTFDLQDDLDCKVDNVVRVQIPKTEIVAVTGDGVWSDWNQLFFEISAKWIFNAVTTGAHVLKGKVFQNIMVDVKVSNNKLYHRAIGIIQRFSGLSKEESEQKLLQSIYKSDTLTASQSTAAVSKHIEVATSMEKVVPSALLSAILKCSIPDSISILRDEPVIRSAISDSIRKAVSN